MGIFDNDGDELQFTSASAMLALANVDLLRDVVIAAVEQGWLLSFGASRDGGACSVSVLSSVGKDRQWCGDLTELERALYAVYKAARGREWTPLADTPSGASEGPSSASSRNGAGNASK